MIVVVCYLIRCCLGFDCFSFGCVALVHFDWFAVYAWLISLAFCFG